MATGIPERFLGKRINPTLSAARRETALRCINAQGRDLLKLHESDMGKLIPLAHVRLTAAAEDERPVIEEILAHLTDIMLLQRGLGALTAAMLYFWPHEIANLLPKHDVSDLPPWMVENYMLWLSQPPAFFSEVGENKRYFDFLTGWTRYLHTSVVYRSHNPFWENLADRYCANSGLTWAYFNDENLNELCSMRGDMLAQVLKWRKCHLDHEFPPRPDGDRPIRLGVLAFGYTAVPETFAALPVFEHLDREKFSVHLYCLQQTGTAMEKYCMSRASTTKLLEGDVKTEAAAIRADDLDILWIARNVTSTSTRVSQLALHRLARVQVTGPGNIVTTGFPDVDGFVSGTFTDPLPEADDQYREKLVRLEGSAHCFSRTGDDTAANITATRAQMGIPDDCVMYASDANMMKLTPELLHAWAEILQAVPNSRLMLFPYGPAWGTQYPKAEFSDHVSTILNSKDVGQPGRVMIVDIQPAPNRLDILQLIRNADIYLDSFPFSGTTSLLEPLEAGLPVVTLRGQNFRTAMGAGMMQELGMEELIAGNEVAYKEIAIRLGKVREYRRAIADKTRKQMAAGPGFLDSKRYADRISRAFREIVTWPTLDPQA